MTKTNPFKHVGLHDKKLLREYVLAIWPEGIVSLLNLGILFVQACILFGGILFE